jgi:hypothetical protein
MAYKYEGIWRALYTLREKQVLKDMLERCECHGADNLHAPVSVTS